VSEVAVAEVGAYSLDRLGSDHNTPAVVYISHRKAAHVKAGPRQEARLSIFTH